MKTNNTEGLTMFEINVLIQQGAKFIVFPFIFSKMVKRIKESNIYFVRPNENTFKYALKHFFLNLSLSWRIIPMGPIYVLKSFYYFLKGGKDYTQDILNELKNSNPMYRPDLNYLQ